LKHLVYPVLALLLLLLFTLSLVYGAVYIPADSVLDILLGKDIERIAWKSIVLQSRLPQAVTAMLAGASLSVGGLLLQTFFRNPLAGPSILGVSDGANLGVAIVMLLSGASIGRLGEYSAGGYVAIVMAALLGAGMILSIILYFSFKVRNSVMLLIIGIMIGYLASSVISILNYYAAADRVRAFVIWGLGDFSAVSSGQLPYYAACAITGLVFALLMMKPLNALLLGENYAANLGVKVRRARIQILFCTGFLTATTTAFCGPVSFIGLAVPHIARLALGSSDHRRLLPVTLLSGSCVALLCNILTIVPGMDIILPLNAVTALTGAPVIIYIIVNRRNVHFFS
jgi:iron complex transport system permease protein